MQTSLKRLGFLVFNSLQDRTCLQNSLGGGEQTHSQPSVYKSEDGALLKQFKPSSQIFLLTVLGGVSFVDYFPLTFDFKV